MNQDQIRMLLEEQGLRQDKIDEFVSEFQRLSNFREENGDDAREMIREKLKDDLANETDPRKKMVIASRIISIGLE